MLRHNSPKRSIIVSFELLNLITNGLRRLKRVQDTMVKFPSIVWNEFHSLNLVIKLSENFTGSVFLSTFLLHEVGPFETIKCSWEFCGLTGLGIIHRLGVKMSELNALVTSYPFMMVISPGKVSMSNPAEKIVAHILVEELDGVSGCNFA